MAGLTLTEALPGPGPISSCGYRPWWETIRFYLLNVLLGIDLMIFYITYNYSSTNCVVLGERKSVLSTVDSKFVNSVCFSQIDGDFRFAGRNVLIGCLLLYIVYSWWEMVPKVGDRFFTVKKVDKLLGEKHLGKSHIKETAVLSKEALGKEKDKQDKLLVIDVCHQLYLHENAGWPLFTMYFIRNLIAIACTLTVAFSPVLSFIRKSEKHIEGTFDCSLDNETAPVVGVTEFLCANSLPSQLYAFFWAIFVILLVIMGTTLVALIYCSIKCCYPKITQNATRTGRILAEDYAFILFFVDHSTSAVHGSTREMLLLMKDEKALNKIGKNVVAVFDKDSLHLLLWLHKGTEVVLEMEVYAHLIRIAVYRSHGDDFFLAFPRLLELLFSEKWYKVFFKLLCFFYINFSKFISDSSFSINGRSCNYVRLKIENFEDKAFVQEIRDMLKLAGGKNIIRRLFHQMHLREPREKLESQLGDFCKDLGEDLLYLLVKPEAGRSGDPETVENRPFLRRMFDNLRSCCLGAGKTSLGLGIKVAVLDESELDILARQQEDFGGFWIEEFGTVKNRPFLHRLCNNLRSCSIKAGKTKSRKQCDQRSQMRVATPSTVKKDPQRSGPETSTELEDLQDTKRRKRHGQSSQGREATSSNVNKQPDSESTDRVIESKPLIEESARNNQTPFCSDV